MHQLTIRLRKRYVVALRKLCGMISHFAVPDAVAALTFDDGPHPQYTPCLLDILSTFNARATFFLVGTSAAQYPELVRHIARAGHAIGNHSWDHKAPFTALSRKARRKQIRQCQQAIAPYGSHILRPPWGARNTGVLLDALCLRYTLIGWNLDVQDWQQQDSHHVAGLMRQGLRPGSIILLHDAIFCLPSTEPAPSLMENRQSMLTALQSFLSEVHSQFRFATIPEMFQIGHPVREY
jgi:peptidoglycan/xylan/chitin deacetylase (PgdA/CDA1 family)